MKLFERNKLQAVSKFLSNCSSKNINNKDNILRIEKLLYVSKTKRTPDKHERIQFVSVIMTLILLAKI